MALGLALVACAPQPQPQQQAQITSACADTGSRVVLEADANDLLREYLFNDAGRSIREELQKEPRIPFVRREVVDGLLNVELDAGADMPSALSRIRALGGGDWFVKQQGDSIVEVGVQPEVLDKMKAEGLAAALEAVQRRIRSSDMKATAAVQEPNRLCVEAPGFDGKQLDRLVEVLTKRGVLTFNLVDEGAVADDYELEVERNGRIALPNDSLGGDSQVILVDAIISGFEIAEATQAPDFSGRPAVAFKLKPGGGQRFGRATSQNVGRSFAIVLDNRIVSAPTIQSPITSGDGQISGNFTKEEAEDLATVLRAGSLPVKLNVIEQVVVGQ